MRLKHFVTNSSRARELIGLGESIASITFGTVNSEDMYRAAIVQGIAALDSYVHGTVLDLGVDILRGLRSPGARTRVGLHFEAVSELIWAPNDTERQLRALTHVNERLLKETFQQPDDIAQAYAMVGVNKIWKLAFAENAAIRVAELKPIVTRRNAIVHQCDRDPTDPELVTPLTQSDAREAIEVIVRLLTE